MLKNAPLGTCIDGRYWRLQPYQDNSWVYDSEVLKLTRMDGIIYERPPTWTSVNLEALKAYKWQKPPAQVLTTALHYISSSLSRGTDPEFFLARNNERLPAFAVLPGKNDGSRPSWFWDGFQAETTVAPAGCHEVVVSHLSLRMDQLASEFKIHPSTVWRVPDTLLESSSDAHVALGCDPSENAYGMHGRQVLYPKMLKWRFAGGHLHQQMPPEERADLGEVLYIVKTIDAILGVPSVALFQNTDHWIRRRYYGLAGEFRRPVHGLEYRTLSNAWAWHPLSAMLVLDLFRQAFGMGRAHLRHVFKGSQRQVVEIINNCDVKAAIKMTSDNRDFYNMWLDWKYGLNRRDAFWRAVDQGIDKVVPNFGLDIRKAWHGIDDYKKAPHWANLG